MTKATELQAKVDKLEELVRKLESQLDDSDIENIKGNYSVRVVSLLPHKIVLCTSTGGRVYKFEKFGEIKRIPYSDFEQVLDFNIRFFRAGFCAVLDEKIIKRYSLEALYDRVLSKESMEEVLSGDGISLAVDLYRSAKPYQRETLESMLIAKMVNGDRVPAELIFDLQKISGIDFLQKAEEGRKAHEIVGH
jgi:hypothetical protein